MPSLQQLLSLPQPQPPFQSAPAPSVSDKCKRSAEDTAGEDSTIGLHDHLTKTPLTNIAKRQRRGLEIMDGRARKEEAGKRKLPDIEEEKDYKTEEP